MHFTPFLTAQESKLQNHSPPPTLTKISAFEALRIFNDFDIPGKVQIQHAKYLPLGDSEVYLETFSPHLFSFHSCEYIAIHTVTERDVFTCIKFLIRLSLIQD